MSEPAAIYEALAKVMGEVTSVGKSDRNDHQRFNFRGIDSVLNAVGPVLRKHGVVVVPDVESVDYEEVHTSTGKPSTACRVVVAYRFFAPDGSTVAARVVGESWDSGDKAAPKAMSVAMRTALIQALALPTDEPDPDQSTYERAQAPNVRESKRELLALVGGDKARAEAVWSEVVPDGAQVITDDVWAKIEEAARTPEPAS